MLAPLPNLAGSTFIKLALKCIYTSIERKGEELIKTEQSNDILVINTRSSNLVNLG